MQYLQHHLAHPVMQANTQQLMCSSVTTDDTRSNLADPIVGQINKTETPNRHSCKYRLNNFLKELETSLSLAEPQAEDEKLVMAEKIILQLEEENTILQEQNSKLSLIFNRKMRHIFKESESNHYTKA